jgi:hypothetical protein
MERLSRSIGLLASVIQSIPSLRWGKLEVNDFAARACFVRALRQIRAASMLAMFGYYSEIGLVLRGAYESAGLGRVLAKDPQKAERWLKKGQWFPEAEVRAWLRAGGMNSESLNDYTVGYQQLSSWAHPTAASCLRLVEIAPSGPSLRLRTYFDEEYLRHWIREITATAVFASFAVRNAAVSETVIDPRWRQDLYELAETVFERTLPHLHRDWEVERELHARYRRRVLPVAGIDERLDADPRSWRNISRDT